MAKKKKKDDSEHLEISTAQLIERALEDPKPEHPVEKNSGEKEKSPIKMHHKFSKFKH